ncbi:MAG: hypothetical protein FJY29_08720 [Betaproteobacteria bacterium]|nr:hypothetical protein [Betaproteobacteria bacterium]
MRMLTISIAACMFLSSAQFIVACGSGNVFEKAVQRSEAEKAQAALESGDVDSAISTLEEYLKNNPNDSAARSMLANAYLKKSGVDLLKIGSSVSSGTEGKSDWSTVSGVLPSGTAANVDNMKAAVDALKSIPPAQRTDEQNYQLAIAQTTLAITVAKKASGDESGQLTDEKVDQMSDSDAMTIYNALQGSKEASGAMQTPNDGLSKVGSFADKVEQQPGSTPEERLRNFLKSQN